MGSLIDCWGCRGAGYTNNDLHGEAVCDIPGCNGGRIAYPVTSEQALFDTEQGCWTDSWECVAEYTEGRCDHCTDLAAAESAWMAEAGVRHRAAGHRCNPYSNEGCHCEEAA